MLAILSSARVEIFYERYDTDELLQRRVSEFVGLAKKDGDVHVQQSRSD